MKIKQIIYVLLPALTALASFAEINDSSFDSGVLYDATSINITDDVDEGWHAYSAEEYDATQYDLWSDELMDKSGYWFGQIFTTDDLTYDNQVLRFNVTYMGIDIQSPLLEYAIYGTDSTDAEGTELSLHDDDNVIASGSDWNLLDSGLATATLGTHDTAISLGETDYEYIAIRFRLTGSSADGRGTDYATVIDDISLAVPEPVTAGLLGIGGILMLLTHRIRRSKNSSAA